MLRLNKKNIQDILALTPMQEGMLFHFLTEPENELYLEQLRLDISGEIDIDLFEKAWDFVIEANEMLRTVFRWDGVEKTIQIILNDYKLNPLYIDLSTSNVNGHQQLKQLEEIQRNDREKKFDLHDVPFRLILCKIEKEKFRMIISNHHILYDGWSTGIILKEFFKAYDDLVNGSELLKPVKSAFKEFVKWNRDRGRDLESEEKFWRNYLSGFEPQIDLPEKVRRRKRKKVTTTGNYQVKLEDDLKDKLERLVKSCNITAASLFYSVWGLLLQKINSSSDVIFDTTVSGRDAKIKGIENIVGLFINTLPLRVKAQNLAGEKIVDFLSRTFHMLQQWSEYESSSLLHVNEYLDEHLHNREGLFDSVVVIENYPLDSILIQKNSVLSVQSYSISGMAPYDLTLLITIFDDITMDFTYNDRLFDRETTVKLAGEVVSILKTIIENPQMKISRLLQLPGEVRDKLLERYTLNGEDFTGEARSDNYTEPYAGPRDLLEEKLARIWAGLYRIDESEISIDRNFFDLGGHSLKAGRLCTVIHRELGIRVSLSEVFRFPTIRKLAKYITRTTGDRNRHVPLIPVKPVERKEYHHLAPAQKRLYMLQQLNPDSTFYNGPSIMRLQGPVDKERITMSFKRLIRRHEILRTSFLQHNGEPVQKIHEEVEFEIIYLAAKTFPIRHKAKEHEDIVRNFIRPFDLSKAPLLRVGLIGTGNLEYLLVIDMHHIITDGTSKDILTGEFVNLYKGETLPPLNIQYKDFSEWQNKRLLRGDLKRHEDYWLEILSGELPMLNISTDFFRPVMQSFAGERISFELPGLLIRQLHLVMKETRVTLYMVLMSVYSILLSWYSGHEDILVGVPVAGRNHADLTDTVGLFLETLVIRNKPVGNKIFEHFLKEVKHTTLTANEHQDYPFSELVRQAATAKMNDLSRNPLFDVMLNVLNQDNTDLELEGVKIIPCPFDAGISKVDITLEVVEKEERIELELEYCTALFKRKTMERFIGHFLNALWSAVYNPKIRLGDIEIIAESEKRQILEEFNNTTVEYAAEVTFMRYFERQVKKKPDKIAVFAQCVDGGVEHITYNELNIRARQLAHLLRERGVQPNTIVGIMVDRSPWLLIGLLGILKVGGAYLPLDPAYPEDRLAYMLKDSNAGVLLSEVSELSELSGGIEVVKLNELREEYPTPPTHSIHPTHLCYVIYTSGSTGRPKGVMVSHKNLTAYIHAFTREFEIREADVVLQQASFCFDAFVEEVFPCLVKGGTLALPCEDEVRDSALLSRFIALHGVNIIDCSPLMLNELNSREQNRPGYLSPLHTIHTFISGGDVLKKEYIGNLLETGSVYNTYGPTETTICATYHHVNQQDDLSGIPIGKPISNYRVYIVDGYHRLLPPGISGEICISGVGVTMGYLNQPELTAIKFCLWRPGGSFYKNRPLDPCKNFLLEGIPGCGKKEGTEKRINKQKFFGGSRGAILQKSPPGRRRLYKTGDLGKWLPDGSIEFLGRKDRQVSVRGFRIELGEIESQLLAHEDIENAAIIAFGEKGNAICAYFTARTQKNVKEMREFLSKKLPDYMIPAYFVQMEEFPLGPGGKINIKALPEPSGGSLDTGVEYIPPTNELERSVLGFWQELLGMERIGTMDDFFDLGGDSILANRCIAAIREEFNVEIPLRRFFEGPSIIALAEEIERQERQVLSAPKSISIGKAPRGVDIPLSFPQERLWFLQALDPENTAYFVPRVIRIKGKLDIELLERTFTEIIRRHEILRTVFVKKEGEPMQYVQPPYDFKIPVMDWSREQDSQQSRKVSRWVREEGRSPFDFEKGPLLRVTLLKLKKHEHLLVLTEHHLVHDGWTQGVLLKEFVTIFSAYLEGKHHGLPELPIQYADFAYWQRNYLQGGVLENHLIYWKQKLDGVLQVLELSGDRSRPPMMSGRGALKDFHLSASLTQQLKDFSRKQGVTLFMTMLAVFKVLLYRYTGTGDLCVGTGIANRSYKEIEGLLGMVINTIPLRTQASGDISFETFLHHVKETCLEAYQHQDTPFERIVEVMDPERSLSYNPIFQVMFSFMDTPTADLQLPGLELHLEPSHNRSSKFDLNIVVVPPLPPDQGREEVEGDAGETLVEWEYNTDIFDDSTLDRMLTHYMRLLKEIINLPGKEISALSMMDETEITQLLYGWNRTNNQYPKEKTFHELFEKQVERSPEGAALVGKKGEIQITYCVLNEKAGQLAHLLKEKGVLADSIVGIMVERSVEMIIGILGILKAGGCYLPIDTKFPGERVAYMLKDSKAKVLLSEVSEIGEVIGGIEVIDLPSLIVETEDADLTHTTHYTHYTQLCYVIYTSGSTGKPKGVMIEHHNVVNFIYGVVSVINFSGGKTILALTTISFDIFVLETLLPLLNGLKIIVASKEEQKVPRLLAKVIKKNSINMLQVTPSSLKLLLNHDANLACLEKVEVLMVGGESFPENLFEILKYKYSGKIYNMYGPTETTVWSTIKELTAEVEITIGSPIANTQVYIIDGCNNPQPVGVVGELCISGDGLARGYVNRPGLTAEKFDHDLWGFQDYQDEKDNKKFLRGIQGGGFYKKRHLRCGDRNVFGDDSQLKTSSVNLALQMLPHAIGSGRRRQKIYKTGDLARWQPNGNIELIGRIDHQVKIRGFRIEPGEIESCLAQHKDINEAVVACREDGSGDKYLCAYVVPHQREYFREEEVFAYLSGNLPGYMVPSYIVILKAIPLNPSGKVDRKSLPEPAIRAGNNYAPPENEIEVKLVRLWSEILDLDEGAVGIDDNFFRLGGHSLKAVTLMNRIHKELSVEVPVTELFKTLTIRGTARYIQHSGTIPYSTIEPVEKKEYYALSSAQKRLYILQQMALDSTGYNMSHILPLKEDVDLERLKEVIRKLISRHESLRTSLQTVNKEIFQKIHDEVEWEIEYFNTEQRAESADIIQKFIRPFDLSQAPLLRLGFITIEEGKHLLILDMHHIITDAASQSMLTGELITLYSHPGEGLSPLQLQYKDYAHWQNSREQQELIKRQETYWLKIFSDDLPILNLPLDYPRPALQSFAGSRIHFALDEEQTKHLKTIARKSGSTPFMMILALFSILLSKLSGEEDIVIGTPTAGRLHPDTQKLIGMFVNTLAIRNYPEGDKTFAGYLEEVKKHTLEAYENQGYQFDQLVEKIPVRRDTSRNPVFDVIFNLLNQADYTGSISLVAEDSEPSYENVTAKFDLNLTAIDLEETFSFSLEYCTKLFKKETIERFIQYFREIVTSVLLNIKQSILEIEILTGSERLLLEQFNNTVSEYPKYKAIHELFAEQAVRIPGRIAVIGSGQRIAHQAVGRVCQLSYGEVNEKSDQLARILRGKGVRLDHIVGIMLENSVEMIIGVLGILKTGGAYLPIDPDYPRERVSYMLLDSGAKVLLKKSKTRISKYETNPNDQNSNNRNDANNLIVLDFEHFNYEFLIGRPRRGLSDFEFRAWSLRNLNSANLAYIIYTSGSTGNPKGVMVEHGSVVRLVKNANYVQFREGDRILQTAPLVFDASTFEIWGSLLNGLTFFLTSKEEILVAGTLKEMIDKYDITTIWMTSPLFNQIVQDDVEVFAGLDNLLVGGDVLSSSYIYRVKRRFPRLEIINGYGPTENTTFSTTFSIEEEYRENIPIGKPIANSVVYIVDKNGQLQPIGVPGELYVGGDGIARGYLNNQELTAEKFDLDLWDYLDYQDEKKGGAGKRTANDSLNKKFLQGPGGSLRVFIKRAPGRRRLYKTGDLARWLPEGNIEFLGRMDFQVKIRGFRIEPGEIESYLMLHDEIKEAVVLVREEDKKEKYLCAYIVFAGKDIVSLVELREYLSVSLPDYMIPSYFVVLEKMPLTANGKIDRKMLPKPEKKMVEKYEAPTDETEKLMAVLWSEVLGIEENIIGLDSNFFELGGHSLKATQLVSSVRKAFNVKLPLAEVFKHPTVRELSAWLRKAAEHKYVSIAPVELKDYYAVSSAQKRLYILQKMDKEGIRYNIPTIYQLEGCIDKERLDRTFKRLIKRHESLRTSFVKVGGEPVQVVCDEVEFEIQQHTLPFGHTRRGVQKSAHNSQEGIIKDFIRPFDLAKAPLVRVGLVRTNNLEHILMVDMHHIITDGGSMGILIREFMKLYSFTDADEELPPFPIQYKDFSEWLNNEQQGKLKREQEAFWLSEFKGEIPVLDLLTDYPGSREQNFAGGFLNFKLGEKETGDLRQLAKEEDVTIYMLLLAIYNVFLSRLSNQEEIIVGTPTAGRRHADLQPLIGMFVNTLALRNCPGENKTFREFLKEIKERTLAAFENQDYPFEDLVEKVADNRDSSRNPLFDVMFTMQNLGLPELEIPGMRLKPYDYEIPVSKFDLTLTGIETGDYIDFRFGYRRSLFKEDTIVDFVNYYRGIIAAVLEERDVKLSQIDLSHLLEVNIDENITQELKEEFEF